MAGHSQFKNIMHRKGAQDAKRARQFAKLIREITVSARQGLPDPASNPRLRAAIAAAREANMPRDTIDRAIKKATGAGAGDDYAEVRYEGYGPSGVAVIVEALTDNRNRTASDVRSAFSKHGGALAETNAVSFMFSRVGVIRYPPEAAGPTPCSKPPSKPGRTTCKATRTATRSPAPSTTSSPSATASNPASAPPPAPASNGVPQPPSPSTRTAAPALLKLVDALEDNDDVQNVYANFDIPDTIMQTLSA